MGSFELFVVVGRRLRDGKWCAGERGHGSADRRERRLYVLQQEWSHVEMFQSSLLIRLSFVLRHQTRMRILQE